MINPKFLLLRAAHELYNKDGLNLAVIFATSLSLALGTHHIVNTAYPPKPDGIGSASSVKQQSIVDLFNSNINILGGLQYSTRTQSLEDELFTQKLQGTYLSLLEGDDNGAFLAESEVEKLETELFKTVGKNVAYIGGSKYGLLDECISSTINDFGTRSHEKEHVLSATDQCLDNHSRTSLVLQNFSFLFSMLVYFPLVFALVVLTPSYTEASETIQINKKKQRSYAKHQH